MRRVGPRAVGEPASEQNSKTVYNGGFDFYLEIDKSYFKDDIITSEGRVFMKTSPPQGGTSYNSDNSIKTVEFPLAGGEMPVTV